MNADQDRRGATRLGRAVRGTTAGAARTAGPHHEAHRQTNWLRDVILGGQDGLVNILGIILGVIAGGGSDTVLIVAGFAAAITESISMGAVGYTSSISERDYYAAERARESAEIAATPEAERQEIRDIYAAKGFTGPLLEEVVSTITANRETWLATMMDEELHLQPVQTRDILRAAIVIGIATLIGHLIPLRAVPVLPREPALILAIVAQRRGPLWRWRLLGRDAGRGLAHERAAVPGDRARSGGGRFPRRVACSTRRAFEPRTATALG